MAMKVTFITCTTDTCLIAMAMRRQAQHHQASHHVPVPLQLNRHPLRVLPLLLVPGKAELLQGFVVCQGLHSTAQHSTAQHSTAQHSTAQHSTAQCQRRLLVTCWPCCTTGRGWGTATRSSTGVKTAAAITCACMESLLAVAGTSNLRAQDPDTRAPTTENLTWCVYVGVCR